MQSAPSVEHVPYEEFIQGVRLVNLGLKSCSAMLNREKWVAIAASDRKEVRTLNDQYQTSDVGERHFDIIAKFTVEVSESIGSDAYLTVECEFEAHFHAAAIQKSLVDRFATSDFRLVIIPYVRQFVSSITMQMSIPPLIIPLSTQVRTAPHGASRSGKKDRRRLKSGELEDAQKGG